LLIAYLFLFNEMRASWEMDAHSRSFQPRDRNLPMYDGAMPTRLRAVLTLAWALGAISCPATGRAQTTSSHDSTGGFQDRFTTVLAQRGVVGGGFGLLNSRGEEEVFATGESNRTTHQKVDAATSYNWASITKTMTAIAILQLRDHGSLSLDDPAVRFVPELREVHDAFGPVDAITIRHLLTHSAGFRNPTWPWDCDEKDNCDWQPFEPTRWAQVAAMLPYTHVAFAPGSRWSYSNLGYVFLGQIIERLSGDDFEVYVDKNILKPLGMTKSYFDRAPYFLESHVSASYLRSGSKLEQQPLDFDTGITTSNSGLKAPITDMMKYLHFLAGGSDNTLYDVVLKRSSIEEAWAAVLPVAEAGHKPTAYTSGPNGAQPRMGLGFFVLETGGHRYIYHDGDQGGFSSELLVDPSRHCASVLVVNTTDTGAPPSSPELHPQSNTEPDPTSDLRMALRGVLIQTVFPRCSETN
jgi:CubicO group peptidase (beta-lactamase class C family)